jgi:16S rRNA (guanine527-N7)-methyltransferase
MSRIDLRRVDLNLLPVFAVLMDERHVSRAAERLGRTQSAVSHALERLRDQLGDAAGDAVEVLDVGSGGGLPGIPLAIVCPHWRITLVDAVQKKAAFLTQAALELKLANVTVHHARVEQLRGSYRVITSRAFAALADFVGWTRHLRASDGFWLAMKARLDPAELRALPKDLSCSAVLPIDVPGLGEQRHLIRIEPR